MVKIDVSSPFLLSLTYAHPKPDERNYLRYGNSGEKVYEDFC